MSNNIDAYLVLGILVFFGLIETISGALQYSKRNKSDWIQEVGSFFILSSLIKPTIVVCVLFLGSFIFPNANGLAAWPLYFSLPFYLLIDDLLQYWYHRKAHENPFLWKLHRSHHQAEEMGYFVSYRNAGLYYLMMPNLWWIGIVTFLGGGVAVAIGLVLKQLVIISSHSTIAWDKPFYKRKLLKPIISVLERIIITPAFHHAHHGKSKLDGASDPNGNFGNMFSIWDQLFGTAVFSRKFPIAYGLVNPTKDHWTASYLYPAVKSKDEKSVLASGFQKVSTASNQPIFFELTKGEKYLYCNCGLSNNKPFCDGSHHGTKFKPHLFVAKQSGQAKLCNCKLTKSAPFCDNSHVDFKAS